LPLQVYLSTIAVHHHHHHTLPSTVCFQLREDPGERLSFSEDEFFNLTSLPLEPRPFQSRSSSIIIVKLWWQPKIIQHDRNSGYLLCPPWYLEWLTSGFVTTLGECFKSGVGLERLGGLLSTAVSHSLVSLPGDGRKTVTMAWQVDLPELQA